VAAESAAGHVLDRLLAAIEVRARAVALCEAGFGWALTLDPPEMPLFHCVLRGTGTLHVQGDRAIDLVPRMIVLVPPGRAQRLEHGPARNEVRGMDHRTELPDGWMKLSTPGYHEQAPLVTACGMVEAKYGGALGLFDRLPGAVTSELASGEGASTALDAMLAELAQPRLGSRAVAEALMKQCVVLLTRRLWQEQGAAARGLFGAVDARLLRALAAIVERPAHGHTLLSLAREAAMSQSAFAAHFVVAFGRSLMAFLRDLRLRRAAALLADTSMPVAEVAHTVGLDSRSYFSRAFRAAYGTDPRSFRARMARSASAEDATT
jgi:AraC-like DNA-binding protein